MPNVDCTSVDVVITTIDNPIWLTRCVNMLMWNTNPQHIEHVYLVGAEGESQGKIVPVPRPRPSPWLDSVRCGLEHCKTPLVLFVQDDCLILPGNTSWIGSLAKPFTVDGSVGVVTCMVNCTGILSQRIKQAYPPGYYYSSSFAPIIMLVKPEAMLDAIREIKEDIFVDAELSLNLLELGWKIVTATNVAQYHEGAQTNLRVYGNDWNETAGPRIKEEVPRRHERMWCARLDACEMMPMVMP